MKMNITAYHEQIATLIDSQVISIIVSEKTVQAEEEAIANLMPDYMEGFKHLLDTLDQNQMDYLCLKYHGFHRFAQMMERIAEGASNGVFDDLL